MLKQGIKPATLIPFKGAILSAGALREYNTLQEVWALFQQSNLQPDNELYEARIQALVYTQHISDAIQLLVELGKNTDMQPHMVKLAKAFFSSFIAAFPDHPQTKDVQDIHKVLQANPNCNVESTIKWAERLAQYPFVHFT
jgi:hypothetical protein